jgi:hypothetical protein
MLQQRNVRSARLAAALLTFGPGGCASPHWVARDPNGGIVAIPANSNYWPTYYRNQADEMMRQVCSQGYVIDHEEQVTVGQTTTTQRNTDTHAYDLTSKRSPAPLTLASHNTTETTTTSDVNEYQITFHAK